jgi:hypothetical protein
MRSQNVSRTQTTNPASAPPAPGNHPTSRAFHLLSPRGMLLAVAIACLPPVALAQPIPIDFSGVPAPVLIYEDRQLQQDTGSQIFNYTRNLWKHPVINQHGDVYVPISIAGGNNNAGGVFWNTATGYRGIQFELNDAGNLTSCVNPSVRYPHNLELSNTAFARQLGPDGRMGSINGSIFSWYPPSDFRLERDFAVYRNLIASNAQSLNSVGSAQTNLFQQGQRFADGTWLTTWSSFNGSSTDYHLVIDRELTPRGVNTGPCELVGDRLLIHSLARPWTDFNLPSLVVRTSGSAPIDLISYSPTSGVVALTLRLRYEIPSNPPRTEIVQAVVAINADGSRRIVARNPLSIDPVNPAQRSERIIPGTPSRPQVNARGEIAFAMTATGSGTSLFIDNQIDLIPVATPGDILQPGPGQSHSTPATFESFLPFSVFHFALNDRGTMIFEANVRRGQEVRQDIVMRRANPLSRRGLMANPLMLIASPGYLLANTPQLKVSIPSTTRAALNNRDQVVLPASVVLVTTLSGSGPQAYLAFDPCSGLNLLAGGWAPYTRPNGSIVPAFTPEFTRPQYYWYPTNTGIGNRFNDLGQFVEKVTYTTGTGSSITTTWATILMTVPTSCNPADVGREGATPLSDGKLDSNDFIVFFDQFFAQDAKSDLAGDTLTGKEDGHHSTDDILKFIEYFFQDCDKR